MQRDRLLASLSHLGIPPSDYRVLKLLPLIYVAWADGKMEKVQKERIHDHALRHHELGPGGMRVLAQWLDQPPSHEYVIEGLRDLYRLALAEDDLEVDFSELAGLLSYAEALARTTANALDQPLAVSPEEEAALEEMARELHVEHGLSWARLLEELGPNPSKP
jgi:hypothetical protein